MFDSSLLKEKINSLIAAGKRNFAIDMSPLDYIYSDTINVLMAMNKRVLDVTGRLTLMAPQPEVMQILKRAGVHNILKIFETETELIKSSEDMILQTTSLRLSDINAAVKEAQPQSEFDQLRSEIGSAFGPIETAQAASSVQGRTGTEEDFNQMFQQIEREPQTPGKTAYGVPPISPQITQPQPPKFQPRQFQQPAAQPIPLRPASPSYPPRQPREAPMTTPDYSSIKPETQRFTSAPGAVPPLQKRIPEAGEGREFPPTEPYFETVPTGKGAKKTSLREEISFDEEEIHEEEFKRKSPIPVFVIVLLVIALAGAGAFIIYSTLMKKKTQIASVTLKQKQPTPTAPTVPLPQIPVETGLQKPEADTQKAAVLDRDIVETKPEKPSTITPARKASPRPPVRKSTPTPPSRYEAEEEQVKVNQVVFTSSPSGAFVTINGEKVGITPYTWKTPFFGKVNVQLSKPGYQTAQKTFEFTGGIVRESFNLQRETAPESAIPQRREAAPEIVQTPTKKTPPPPPAAVEEEDLFQDVGEEEEFPGEIEPSRAEGPTTPSRTKPSTESSIRTPTPSPTTTSRPPLSTAVGGGGEALIFIASIPPVADVFLNDQLIGKTNVSELKIPAGLQTLRFVKGAKEITKQFNLQPGKNPSQMVRIP